MSDVGTLPLEYMIAFQIVFYTLSVAAIVYFVGMYYEFTEWFLAVIIILVAFVMIVSNMECYSIACIVRDYRSVNELGNYYDLPRLLFTK